MTSKSLTKVVLVALALGTGALAGVPAALAGSKSPSSWRHPAQHYSYRPHYRHPAYRPYYGPYWTYRPGYQYRRYVPPPWARGHAYGHSKDRWREHLRERWQGRK